MIIKISKRFRLGNSEERSSSAPDPQAEQDT